MPQKPSIPDVILTAGNATCRLLVSDLTDPELSVEASLPHGLTITADVQDLMALGNAARSVWNHARSNIDQQRRALHHPMWLDGNPSAYTAVDIGDNENYPVALRLASAPETDTTALLMWSQETIETETVPGWRLAMMGSRSMSIGFAPWNDETAVRSLVSQMADPESLQVVAGMVDPERMSHLTSRQVARALLEEKALKRITLTKIRAMLNDNNLGTSDTLTRDGRVLLRILALKFDGKRLPIAVALMAPANPEAAATEMAARAHEYTGQSYAVREQVRQSILTRHHDAWEQGVRAALPSTGWRLIDLPAPNRGWRNRGCPIVWATPVPEDTWSLIARAAEVEAGNLEMNRGTPA